VIGRLLAELLGAVVHGARGVVNTAAKGAAGTYSQIVSTKVSSARLRRSPASSPTALAASLPGNCFKFNAHLMLLDNQKRCRNLKKLIEMPYQSGSTVMVAVEITEEQARDEISKMGAMDFLGTPTKVDQNFGIVSDMIIKCVKPIVESSERLGRDSIPPKKAKAEFGLSFNGRGNVYLVETSLQGSIKISLEWELGTESD
jgi:hypothetical protein